VKIVSVEAIPLEARLRAPFRFGLIERTTSSNVLVRLMTDAGVVGWGEACPVPQLTPETSESIVAAVENRLRPAMIGASVVSWRPLMGRLRALLSDSTFALAAAEMAVLDAAGQTLGISVAELVGGRFHDSVEVHGSIGWDEDAREMVAMAERQAEFKTLKLYVGRGDLESDLMRLRAVRDSVGPTRPFIVDVNGLWSRDDVRAAGPALKELGVVMVEQPIAPDDTDGQQFVAAELMGRCGVDVTADERVRRQADVLDVARERLAGTINIGVSKLGGIGVALEVATVARAANLQVTVGSVVELGIATAAGVQLASAIPDLAYPSYLMGPLKYVRQVTWPPPEVVDSRVAVPVAAGLGVDVDQEAVEALDLRRAI
jgi:L-alanine-DL-glutamate epimerase-like enolase superfamily enzyme